MNLYDHECEIIRDFQLMAVGSTCLAPGGEEDAAWVVESILVPERWANWSESAGKGDPPPDFFCDMDKLMMDVMRIDDHGFVSPKGKLVNPTLAKEHEIIRMLQQKTSIRDDPNIRLQVLTTTDLPKDEDHNYRFYRDNFIRTVQAHQKKIKRYKENHPGYRVVFFVMDESSAYFELDSRNERIIEGEWSTGIPHLWYRDEVFVNAFVSSEIDYLIWYAPFKHCDAFSETDGTPFTPPSAVVYNIREFCAPLIKYDEERMDSTEA